jgi:hypothetical protein
MWQVAVTLSAGLFELNSSKTPERIFMKSGVD